MEQYFINFTNHPAAYWDEKQKAEAEKYGKIVELSFPMVDAAGDEAYIEALAEEYVDKIMRYQPEAVLCQGEFCLCYQVINRLKRNGVKVLAACSKRITKEVGNKKESVFVFERFRCY